MDEVLPYLEPPADLVWVPLIPALGWIRYRHAAELADFLLATSEALGLTEEDSQALLQETWCKLADESSVSDVHVRGYPEGSQREQRLSIDDLRNCRWLSWQRCLGNAPVVRVERYGNNFSKQWDRLGDTSGPDFRDIVVGRQDLLRLHPTLRIFEQRHRASTAQSERALAWLEGELDSRTAASVTKSSLVRQMVDDFGVSRAQALQNWTGATKSRPKWTRSGPRGKRNSNP